MADFTQPPPLRGSAEPVALNNPPDYWRNESVSQGLAVGLRHIHPRSICSRLSRFCTGGHERHHNGAIHG